MPRRGRWSLLANALLPRLRALTVSAARRSPKESTLSRAKCRAQDARAGGDRSWTYGSRRASDAFIPRSGQVLHSGSETGELTPCKSLSRISGVRSPASLPTEHEKGTVHRSHTRGLTLQHELCECAEAPNAKASADVIGNAVQTPADATGEISETSLAEGSGFLRSLPRGARRRAQVQESEQCLLNSRRATCWGKKQTLCRSSGSEWALRWHPPEML
jgi:hypothetical protein